MDVHPTHQIQWNRRVARDSQIYTAVPENSAVFQRVDRSVGLGKMGSRGPCRFTEGYQVKFKRQKTSVEIVPNDTLGSSTDPITTAPIDLENENPDPVSTGLTSDLLAAHNAASQPSDGSTEQQKDDASDSEWTVHKVFTGGYLHPYREMLVRRWKITKKYTMKELEKMIEPGYFDGDSQHDPECMCYSCKLVWDK